MLQFYMVINRSISAMFHKSPILFWIGLFDSQTGELHFRKLFLYIMCIYRENSKPKSALEVCMNSFLCDSTTNVH